MPASPRITPAGMPAAPMQTPSNSTEFLSCFLVAPTDIRMPNCRVRSFKEMLKALRIKNTDPSIIIPAAIPPTV